jgi:hypothetical protein
MVATNTDLYTTDFSAWCLTTADLVRTGQWDAIDPAALAEELESMGRSEKRALESDLEVLLVHLLKWQYQSDYRDESHSWYDTIVEHRSRIVRLLGDNPSLRPQVEGLVQNVYPTARTRALIAMAPSRLPTLPERPGLGGRVAELDVQLPTNKRLLREMARLVPLPSDCPWTPAQILDADFWPD